MICNQCPRECGIDRNEASGFCGVKSPPKLARVAPHYDEEPPISGINGAGTIFFCGCSLRCVFCQNYAISAQDAGRYVTPRELSEEYRRLEEAGVHNIELVTPSHYTDAILESMEYYRPHVPIIWNSSGYEKVETLKRLDGVVDIYLPDFKYSDSALAQRLSNCPDYPGVAADAIKEMIRQCGDIVMQNGLMKRGVMIRHLVLPSHVRNSIGVLEIIKEKFGTRAAVSLMAQYFPAGRAEDYPDVNRRLTKREYNRVLEKFFDLGLDGFAQELESSDEKYVPVWDY